MLEGIKRLRVVLTCNFVCQLVNVQCIDTEKKPKASDNYSCTTVETLLSLSNSNFNFPFYLPSIQFSCHTKFNFDIEVSKNKFIK